MKTTFFAFFVLLIFLVGACNQVGSVFEKNELAPYTNEYFDSVITKKIQSVSYADLVKQFPKSENSVSDISQIYKSNGNQLIWQTVERERDSQDLKDLLEVLKSANIHGFQSEWYHINELNNLYDNLYKIDSSSIEMPIEKVIGKKVELDILATAASLSFLKDVGLGYLKPKWDIEPRKFDFTKILRDTTITFKQKVDKVAPKFKGYYELGGALLDYQEIKKQGGWQNLNEKSSGKEVLQVLLMRGCESENYDECLNEFQQSNGLTTSGKLDKKTLEVLNKSVDDIIDLIKLNLERYRWLPDILGTDYVFVNIPDYKIKVIENNKPVVEMKAVVGETISPTPIFFDEMEYMVFSPVWNIPQSIAREEIFKWIEINPGILYAGDTEVYYKGKKVDPYSVNWAEAKKDKRSYSFKQKPTNQNSLGDVKFIFPNKHSVYLHDTPAKKYFKQDYRALSSGCVRVEKPAELAHVLLKDKEGWTIERIKQNMAGTKERRVDLPQKVPVYIFYLTAWVDADGKLQTRKDIYKHDKKQLDQLF